MQKRVDLSWSLPVVALLVQGDCGSTPKDPIDSHEPQGVVILLEPEGREGPYVEGTTARFRVIASDEALSTVRWSATAGVIEPDAEHVAGYVVYRNEIHRRDRSRGRDAARRVLQGARGLALEQQLQ
jgi:hypothetical protein